MTTTPKTAAESADSNKCICCKRSKTGGSFFEVRPYREEDNESVSNAFLFGYWDADIDVFQEASRQGCQRCAVAFDMVATWRKDNAEKQWRDILVWNGIPHHSLVAEVRVWLSVSPRYRYVLEKSVVLELLSANRRCLK